MDVSLPKINKQKFKKKRNSKGFRNSVLKIGNTKEIFILYYTTL